MEVLLGMILLLQVFALIQNMLTHRQVLQRINKQEKNIETLFEQAKGERLEEKNEEVIKNQKAGKNYILENGQADPTEEERQKAAQEALLNEVLSEIFS